MQTVLSNATIKIPVITKGDHCHPDCPHLRLIYDRDGYYRDAECALGESLLVPDVSLVMNIRHTPGQEVQISPAFRRSLFCERYAVEHKEHSMWCNVKFLFRGLVGVGKFLLRIDRAEASIISQRRQACAGCFARSNNTRFFSRCTQCGCWIFAKAAISKEGCKLGKW